MLEYQFVTNNKRQSNFITIS